MDGGGWVAAVLEAQGVKFLFCLCGGHISPILVSCKRLGIRVIDVRHEATAVFAADAVTRLTGVPGVAAVTAGPGVSNTITAIKNAQMSQSALILLGGAAATVLRGRGSLQDIDQMALVRPHVKWAVSVKRVSSITGTLLKAFEIAASGVPGPVFVELPIDLLYEEQMVRSWYAAKSKPKPGAGFAAMARAWYLRRHTDKLFAGSAGEAELHRLSVPGMKADTGTVKATAADLDAAERPVLLLGSQVVFDPAGTAALAEAMTRLGVPVYLSGMARGLLGRDHPLQFRHRRRDTLKAADLVLLAGVPCDFRLDYGAGIGRHTRLITVNRSRADLTKNRRPQRGVLADPGPFLIALAAAVRPRDRGEWHKELARREAEREEEIQKMTELETAFLNPLALLRGLEEKLGDNSLIVADGGDFIASAAYTLRPRTPLSWLDPGPFGTLGVGAGLALGAALCRPDARVWLLYGDGAAGFSISEFDTFVRHGLGIVALVGNDACWSQIARDQIEILHDDVGTVLRHTDYHAVAAGWGGEGLLLKEAALVPELLDRASKLADAGKPVLINALIGKTEFRKGSISM